MSETLAVEPLLESIQQQLRAYLDQRQIDNPLLVGIRTGGVWLAERLHQALEPSSPVGVLDISFYRDDFTRIGLNPKVRPSALNEAVEGRHIVLVDDVLMTGRTIRAGLNELFDYGRPASVTLVALVDLEARELPIRADVVGRSLNLDPGQQLKLTGPEPLRLELQEKNR
ncbi:bifunctional pyr operon transcriptional regulator/uracil phosphoribosyltransferase PyrR [Motiliproteus sp. SC1-56]|uniref:bifunctional pyr operon transcriptional regulator/uracil phosphoribosyltransferase PyrR n=1 Tax=Motiliproteus sp. SC1-56 TaxID=2799565 RepID=UPI001A8DCC7B|nr:bifunctional pyr operon transcriptional regulator/uracil phosphoribosyltransferase PyrR [Motiliproteus sp. SC1-56]